MAARATDACWLDLICVEKHFILKNLLSPRTLLFLRNQFEDISFLGFFIHSGTPRTSRRLYRSQVPRHTEGLRGPLFEGESDCLRIASPPFVVRRYYEVLLLYP